MQVSAEKPGLKRALSPRHLNMIAIGGSIGTGLFVATGATIATSGPGGTLLAYALIGIMVYFLMTSLGEMAAHMPVAGSFSTYGSKFVEDGFGFALGWNYWYNWAVTIAAELVAAQLVMSFWFPDVPGVYWSALFLGLMFLLNVISVRNFGESEFWFALIKVITVVVFIIIGLATIFGLMHGVESPGFSNFTSGDAPFVGGFQAMVGVVMIAGFAFQGTEIVGVAAAESKNPSKNVPIAVRQVFWRITLFYILAIFVIGMLIPYTDPSLLRNETTDISVSPFTLLFERAGFAAAAAVMNAVILTAILSAGNSGMYASTRMLYSLAMQGKAPKLFAKVSRSGVPRNALYATTLIGALCFLTSAFGDKVVYNALLNTSGMCGFIAWLGIAVSHYRFRKGFLAQGGRLQDLPYRAKWFPFGPLFAFALCLFITLGQNYSAFMGDHIDWGGLVATYISLPLFLAIWLGYRFKHRCRLVKYGEMDVGGLRADEAPSARQLLDVPVGARLDLK
ncbi:amino acid permease [Pseudomonas sp. PS24]|uniref:amino acid permease n=1 Tax=Pseudomonas akapageensis TaxID=2609961 RepID=UPI00140E79C7